MQHREEINKKESSDFIRLFKLLWKDRNYIIFSTFIFAVLSVIFSLSLTEYYKSESILTIEESDVSLSSQIGGLGTLSTFGLMSPQDDKSFEAIEMINSRDFLKHLLNFDGVMASIMAASKYDKDNSELLFDDDLYDSDKDLWTEGEKPTHLEVYEEYVDMVSASINSSGFISIKVEHISPFFAQELLSLIIKETNKLAREKEIKKANASLAYLKNEISSTSLDAVNNSLSRLMEVQYNKLIAARLNQDYLLVPLEKPFVPERKSKPNRPLICILGTILGALLSIFWVILRDSIKRENDL
mgnify:CR=1 FL=1